VLYFVLPMPAANDVRSPLTTEAQRNALATVLASRTFSKNPRLAALLEYLCVRYLHGETDAIKEYNIATDVFGRPADFDQSSDAIVRVEMHRLRKKLKEFYAGEGADQSLEIVIQSGRYLPEFVSRPKGLEIIRPGEPSLQPPGKAPFWKLPAARKSRALSWVAVATIGLTIAVLMAALISFKRISGRTAGPESLQGFPAVVTPSQPPPIAIRPGDGARLRCGSSKTGYRDRRGNEWGADAFFSGGVASELPAQPIYRTRDPMLFRSKRSGEFSYKIPLKPGVYEMRLYFADTSYTPGGVMDGGENLRVFTILLNDAPILRNFDIIADAGPSTADVRVFKDVQPAPDGYVHLAFSKETDMPLINAIEIVPGTPNHLLPTQIITQDNTLVDRNGITWSPDDYFLGGRTIARFGTVTGPDDPEIYARERYGNFSYAIPVADGRYTAKLHFAETFWGPDNPGGGGQGSRIFDLYCNGTALVRNFDIFHEAGSRHQVIKTFHGLQPNAQGKLFFSFVPRVNYANISAIEVIDEMEEPFSKTSSLPQPRR
jgi:Malectin domain